jgi:hypothetical protein
MTFVVCAFTVFHYDHLGRFMVNIKYLCYLSGQRAIGQQIQVIEVGTIQILCIFQAVPGRTADTAAGAVFENDLRALMGQTDDIVQLPGGKKIVPVHIWGLASEFVVSLGITGTSIFL